MEYLRKLILDNKLYFVGFSSSVDAYTTKLYDNLSALTATEVDDQGKPRFSADIQPDKIEETIIINSAHFEEIKKTILQLEGGFTSLTSEEKQRIETIDTFISNVMGYFSKSYPKEIEKTMETSAGVLGLVKNRGTYYDSVLDALESVVGQKEPEKNEAILAGRFLHKLLENTGFYKNPPVTIKELFDNIS